MAKDLSLMGESDERDNRIRELEAALAKTQIREDSWVSARIRELEAALDRFMTDNSKLESERDEWKQRFIVQVETLQEERDRALNERDEAVELLRSQYGLNQAAHEFLARTKRSAE